MLTIFYSNKLEALSIKLSALLRHEPLPPLAKEQIVVESAAMMQWLQGQLAQHMGIAANLDFPFPAALVWQIYREQMPDLPRQTRFDRSPLVWRLYDRMVRLRLEQNPEFGLNELKQYVGQLSNDHQLMTFAQLVANLYDQYQIYRPKWLIDWRNGGMLGAETFPWQAELWRILCNETIDEPDRASVFADALTHFPLPEASARKVAHRLHFFAVSTLPEAYMQLFGALAQTIDVNLYVLNPCAEFWGDVKPWRQVMETRVAGLSTETLDAATTESIDGSNELLAMLARQPQDFVNLLQTLEASDDQLFVESPDDTLLARLQNDVLYLRQHDAGMATTEKSQIPSSDQSLTIHACHSELREVQVLHDELLRYFNQHPQLAWDDVAVMVTNLETYAPYIQSVFATADDGLRLPFHIAEKQGIDGEPVKTALLDLLQLSGESYARSSVIRLLQEPVIARSSGIDDVNLIEQLIGELNVRFGLYDADWQVFGDQVVPLSWQQASQRLVSSFALPDQDDMWSATLAGIDGGCADQAGYLCQFIENLGLLGAGNAKRSLNDWCTYVSVLLERFFGKAEDQEEREVFQINEALQQLHDTAELAEFNQPLDLRVFVDRLEQAMTQAASHHYFRPGCINIATLLPMRSIPFQRICVLGMNDGTYPTPSANNQLDLMLQTPKRGDRNKRDEERYLFLEALLAARESLYISYIGRSHIDNSERYPSLLVTELLNHIDAGYTVAEQKEDMLSQALTRRHHLQPFDPRYFIADSRMQSFHPNHQQQAKILSSGVATSIPAFGQDIDVEMPTDIDLSAFCRAIVQPHRDCLTQIGIALDVEETVDEDNECFVATGLENYQLLIMALERRLRGASMPAADVLTRYDLSPQAALGESTVAEQLQLADAMIDSADALGLALTQSQWLEPLQFELPVGDLVVRGVLNQLAVDAKAANIRLGWAGRRLHGRHALRVWIEHLIAQCVLDRPVTSYLLEADAVWRILPLEADDAASILASLAMRIRETRQSPCWFFARSSFTYMQLLGGDDRSQAKAPFKLEEGIIGTSNVTGEWQDPYSFYALRGCDSLPLPKVIAEAEAVFGPMFDVFEAVEEVSADADA
ncbi:RecBCD enzyme subunit RecC [BD1-7 clade bacterium]|uniref:RecBCD enzyme subunit RecC n=1 Tax=BD1-7 clade bacterium TaxID=2029982 RepID=A0A5S9PPX5_9GAMM|nr:RecBCD enzyme subunit RecC [BD1-7 clade bacterium]